MIGIDTNILLRYLTQDDPVQSGKAAKLIDSFTPAAPGFVPLICIAELYWVLDHTFKLSRPAIHTILDGLITADSLCFEQDLLVRNALDAYSKGSADFDDYLIARCAATAGCQAIFTFDKIAANSGLMRLLT